MLILFIRTFCAKIGKVKRLVGRQGLKAAVFDKRQTFAFTQMDGPILPGYSNTSFLQMKGNTGCKHTEPALSGKTAEQEGLLAGGTKSYFRTGASINLCLQRVNTPGTSNAFVSPSVIIPASLSSINNLIFLKRFTYSLLLVIFSTAIGC
jgi:hypothetical protein